MAQGSSKKRGPWLWPLALAIIGIGLLLNNFLLLGDFNLLNLWPLSLVIIGAQVLLRGDFAPSWDSRTFGITRGSVESATLEISSGEIDTYLSALPATSQERLIAGQFAVQARPNLKVQNLHAHLQFKRADTPWLTFADWEIGLARDLPWNIFATAYLGNIYLDLENLIIEKAAIYSGIGDIRLTLPLESFDVIRLRATLGNIYLRAPIGVRAHIHIQSGRFVQSYIDENRYQHVGDNVYLTQDIHPELPNIDVYLHNTFGDIYLV